MNYSDYCVGPDLTVRDALKAIDKTNAHIVFIIKDFFWPEVRLRILLWRRDISLH